MRLGWPCSGFARGGNKLARLVSIKLADDDACVHMGLRMKMFTRRISRDIYTLQHLTVGGTAVGDRERKFSDADAAQGARHAHRLRMAWRRPSACRAHVVRETSAGLVKKCTSMFRLRLPRIDQTESWQNWWRSEASFFFFFGR